jgi:hypothetical protein
MIDQSKSSYHQYGYRNLKKDMYLFTKIIFGKRKNEVSAIPTPSGSLLKGVENLKSIIIL